MQRHIGIQFIPKSVPFSHVINLCAPDQALANDPSVIYLFIVTDSIGINFGINQSRYIPGPYKSRLCQSFPLQSKPTGFTANNRRLRNRNFVFKRSA